MLKIELHWQILIALVIGVIAGIFLTPHYKIDQKALDQLSQKYTSIEYVNIQTKRIEKKQVKSIPKTVVSGLKQLKGQTFKNEKVLIGNLENTLSPEDAAKYKKEIIQAAKIDRVSYISWMGDIFLRALKMIIIPLILSSIISGIANIQSGKNLGRLGLKTIGYYLITSLFAIVTGLLFVNLIQPGTDAPKGSLGEIEGLDIAKDSFGDTLMNMIPTNIFSAFTSGSMLSIIFFAILFGYFITRVEPQYKATMSGFFNAIFEVMMKITLFIIKFTPLGVLGLVAAVVAEQAGNPEALAAMAGSMGKYMLTVILALAVHFFITLPLMVKFIGKANPFAHLRAMANALLTAFSTSSSSATLPLTMEMAEHKSGVSNKITSFTLPLGATINMDGTALYECVAAMFIAQAYGIQLGVVEQVIVVATALLASIGAAGIPMAGLVMISVILSAVGLPLEGIGMILAVDRILDMLRTTTNVWSDSCGAVIIAKSEGEQLRV